MKLTVLGSGTSHGIPVIGCECPVCKSLDPKDNRMRASLYIEGDDEERVVIDTGPDFRTQALRVGLKSLDAVFLTHAHADHVHGLDDVRSLSYEREIPVYGNAETLKELKERFSYAFQNTQRGGGKPRINLNPVRRPVQIGGITLTPIPVKHGRLDILGWKISKTNASGPFAVYLTDTSFIPQASLDLIRPPEFQGPEVLIVGGLRVRPHETHFSFEQALSTGVDIRARHVYLTHICHGHSHREITAICRRFRNLRGLEDTVMEPGYDRMEFVL
ncbi:MBL fold metallo-hydrolase [Spirochaetia bacterium]|nr:MBL fold metallo-hydrolase [Spirochaetia bacterium]